MKSTTAELLDAVEAIRPMIAENAAGAETERVLNPAVYGEVCWRRAVCDARTRAAWRVRTASHRGASMGGSCAINSSAAWNLVMNQAIADMQHGSPKLV